METIILNIIVGMLIILTIAVFIVIFIDVYAFSDKTNHRYCQIFDCKQLNLWKYMHANVSNFRYDHTYKGSRYFVWGHYEAIIWADDGLTSVHDNNDAGECILCAFDIKSSGKMSELLLNRVGVPDNEEDLYDPSID